MAFIQLRQFLPAHEYQGLVASIARVDEELKDYTFNSSLERLKTVYKLESLNDTIKLHITLLSGDVLKKMICDLTGWDGKVFSLFEFDGFGGYCPYHAMKCGGFLAPHVDHSYILNKEFIHIANCIYYASSNWLQGDGGETYLMSAKSLSISDVSLGDVQVVKPIPNSLLLFSHDSLTFHGVKRFLPSSEYDRITFYMDYYIRSEDLRDFSSKFYHKTGEEFIHAWHLTTFIPFNMSNNLKGDIISIALRRSSITYLRQYMRYLESLASQNQFCLNMDRIAGFNRLIEYLDSFLSRTLIPFCKPAYKKLSTLFPKK